MHHYALRAYVVIYSVDLLCISTLNSVAVVVVTEQLYLPGTNAGIMKSYALKSFMVTYSVNLLCEN